MTEWQLFLTMIVVVILVIIQVIICVSVFKHGVNERDGDHIAICAIQTLLLLVVFLALLTWYFKL